MVHAPSSWWALVHRVFLSVAALAAVAFVWSRLYPGLVRYSVSVAEPSPPKPLWGGWAD